MHLRSIALRDWRAYGGSARFDFPAPTSTKCPFDNSRVHNTPHD